MAKKTRKLVGPYTHDTGDIYWILPLTKGMHAKISDADSKRVTYWNWSVSREGRDTKWYAVRYQKIDGVRKKIRLHRYVMDQPPGMVGDLVVDHLNDDGLDCRRANLQIITQEENMLRSFGWKKRPKEKVEPSL